LEGEAIEIRNILDWGEGLWAGTTSSRVVGLANAAFTLAAFFFDFPASVLVAVDLGSGFFAPAFCLVADTLGCLGTSVTR